MANTYEAIATVTVGSGGATDIDFTSIPATFTDLVVKLSLRSNQNLVARGILLKFNGNSLNYSGKLIDGDGTSAGSFNASTTSIDSIIINGTGSTASTFSNTEVYIFNYAGSTNKSVSIDNVLENNATLGYQDLVASLWSDSAAINQITFTIGAGLYAQYSTATLYGIKN
jgi:hypothetical protein